MNIISDEHDDDEASRKKRRMAERAAAGFIVDDEQDEEVCTRFLGINMLNQSLLKIEFIFKKLRLYKENTTFRLTF